MGIANTGAGGGDREDVDSVDPYVHVTVRGLFGIEPALHENRIDICPAFPSDWTAASIRTPDIAYDYRRSENKAVFKIHTDRALVKRVRANLAGSEFVTPEEKDSTVSVSLGATPTPPDPPRTSPCWSLNWMRIRHRRKKSVWMTQDEWCFWISNTPAT